MWPISSQPAHKHQMYYYNSVFPYRLHPLNLSDLNFAIPVATKTPTEAKPFLGRGGLLADSMGLGENCDGRYKCH